jgi:DNA-nicking Smr family endonuclease
MPRRPRTLTEHDQAYWVSFIRQVTPLPGRAIPVLPPAAPPPAAAAPPRPQLPTVLPARTNTQIPAYLATGTQPAGLDNASWNRFRAGKLAPARTLDLHGKTAQAAYHLLERFLHTAIAEHLRCVEIITGRGSGESGGVIRRELPLWLNLPTLRPLILAAAHPHAANQGATRLLLKRPR